LFAVGRQTGALASCWVEKLPFLAESFVNAWHTSTLILVPLGACRALLNWCSIALHHDRRARADTHTAVDGNKVVAFWAVLHETCASALLSVPVIKTAHTSFRVAFPLASLSVKRVAHVIIVCGKQDTFALLCHFVEVALKSID
jgi:hypothetical protein